jgi:hypothetical protein
LKRLGQALDKAGLGCLGEPAAAFREHMAVATSVSTFLVNEVFLGFRLADSAFLDMLDVS